MKEEQTAASRCSMHSFFFIHLFIKICIFFIQKSASKKGEATAALLRRDLQNTTLTLSTPSHLSPPHPPPTLPAPPPPHAATLTATQSLHRKSHTVSHERLHAASLLTLREGRGRWREGEGEGVHGGRCREECVSTLCCPNRRSPSRSAAAVGVMALDRRVPLEC